MKPPMNNEAIIISKDRTKERDRHGKFPEKRQPTKARVQHSAKVFRQNDGTFRRASLEIDVPAETVLTDADGIEAKDSQGVWHKGLIISTEDATNFAGNRIFYRTVYCE